METLGKEVKKLRSKHISIKIQWCNQNEREATWEVKNDMFRKWSSCNQIWRVEFFNDGEYYDKQNHELEVNIINN